MNLTVTESWGYPKEDGLFDGMVGMLQRGQIQMGVTPAVITPGRLDVVDFTLPTWKLRTCFIFRHPRLLVPYKALVEPFAGPTWLGVAGVAAAAALILWAIRYWDDRIHGEAISCTFWQEAVLIVIGVLSQQGSSANLRLVAGRVVLLAALLLSLMLQSFYTSAIVTSLLTPIPRTIRTAADLIHSPLRVGLEDYSYNRAVFPASADPLTSQLYREKVGSSGFYSVPDGISLVRRDNFAFYSEDSTLYKPIQESFSDDEKCALSEVELNPPFATAAPLLKNSPYRELFNRGLLMMIERGLRSRQRRLWSAQPPSCDGEANAVAAVGLAPIFLAHALLLVGMLLALAVLTAERCTATQRARSSSVATDTTLSVERCVTQTETACEKHVVEKRASDTHNLRTSQNSPRAVNHAVIFGEIKG